MIKLPMIRYVIHLGVWIINFRTKIFKKKIPKLDPFLPLIGYSVIPNGPTVTNTGIHKIGHYICCFSSP